MVPKNQSWEVVKHSASPKILFFFGASLATPMILCHFYLVGGWTLSFQYKRGEHTSIYTTHAHMHIYFP